MMRQVIVLIPLILIFGRLFGLYGIVYATPVADCVSLVFAGALALREMYKLSRKAREDAAAELS
jgi:Na+-driven multidrug efflux pump